MWLFTPSSNIVLIFDNNSKNIENTLIHEMQISLKNMSRVCTTALFGQWQQVQGTYSQFTLLTWLMNIVEVKIEILHYLPLLLEKLSTIAAWNKQQKKNYDT